MNHQQQVDHYKAVRLRIANAAKKIKEAKEAKESVEFQLVLNIPKDPRKEILKSVAKEFMITVEDIRGDCRKPVMKQARWKAAWLLHQRGTMSVAAIAKFLGKDHTTILHALKNYRPELGEKSDVEHGAR